MTGASVGALAGALAGDVVLLMSPSNSEASSSAVAMQPARAGNRQTGFEGQAAQPNRNGEPASTCRFVTAVASRLTTL